MKATATHLIFLLLLPLFGACSTTQVQESWRLPGYQAPAPQKILVVALANQDSMRRAIESSFTAALEEKGHTAIPSANWISDGTRLTREALQPLVQQNGITTVLVTSVREVQKSAAYQPDPATASDDGLFRNIDTYYAYSSTGQHEGGSYAQVTDYLIETSLFDASNSKLSWTVITRTSEPKALKEGLQGVIKAVMQQGDKDKVL